MKHTVLRGILQTLILLTALFLISVQVVQLIDMAANFAMMNEAGYDSAEVEEALFRDLERADEAVTDQVGIAENAETEAEASSEADDAADLYSLSNMRGMIIKALNDDPRLCGFIYAGMFLLIMMAALAEHYPLMKKDAKARIMVLADAGLYLGCGIPFLIQGYTITAVSIMTLLYSLTVIGESIVKLKAKHTPARTVCRVILILATVANFMFIRVLPFFVLAIIVLRAFKQIMIISFSQIRMDILRKIIRKTYAYEILLGLFLLMFAFALLLCMLDDGMPNFLDALWFCFATVTTIGYGDITATTALGRILSAILGVYGIIVVALVTSIIVNFYNEMKSDQEEKGEEVRTDEPGKES